MAQQQKDRLPGGMLPEVSRKARKTAEEGRLSPLGKELKGVQWMIVREFRARAGASLRVSVLLCRDVAFILLILKTTKLIYVRFNR